MGLLFSSRGTKGQSPRYRLPDMAPDIALLTESLGLSVAEERSSSNVIVIAGLGMVALSFIEKMKEYDTDNLYKIKVFSEEPHGEKKNLFIVHGTNSFKFSSSGI